MVTVTEMVTGSGYQNGNGHGGYQNGNGQGTDKNRQLEQGDGSYEKKALTAKQTTKRHRWSLRKKKKAKNYSTEVLAMFF